MKIKMETKNLMFSSVPCKSSSFGLHLNLKFSDLVVFPTFNILRFPVVSRDFD